RESQRHSVPGAEEAMRPLPLFLPRCLESEQRASPKSLLSPEPLPPCCGLLKDHCKPANPFLPSAWLALQAPRRIPHTPPPQRNGGSPRSHSRVASVPPTVPGR